MSNEIVRINALQHLDRLVRQLGGDPEALIESSSIPLSVLRKYNAVVPFRALVQLLERAATELNCPSFGLQLATLQGGASVLGPLEIAMRNAVTLGDAYRYCQDHLQAYSPVVQIKIEQDPRNVDLVFIRFDILLSQATRTVQAVEHSMALMHHAIIGLSEGAVRPSEVWLTHDPVSSESTYKRYFGTRVRFGSPMNAVFLKRSDLNFPLPNRSELLYELATTYIDARFPTRSDVLTQQVRAAAARLLPIGRCNHVEVAASLGMHPRTLQRRLREEGGLRFNDIKEEVRRDLALQYLSRSDLSLARVAAKLGYSEPSVLTRSCRRWFAQSPTELRSSMLAGRAA
ncbi:MAG: AraC family transcriptional regulator [Gammaproteobacteria bacterium]|nr:AraC family transcriptional regulator [Gammaproteobacteria bacterium]